jgi:hypothetical protein
VGLFNRQNRDERFWQWFQSNSARLFDFEADREAVFADLSAALRAVDKGLVFEFGPPERPREFVVSADGILDRFPIVTSLVDAAPQMPDWNIIAFRQPGKSALEITFGDQHLGPDDLWFRASQSEVRTDLELCIRGLTEANHEVLAGAAFILLDNALGEFDVATRVGAIEWRCLPDDPAGDGLLPLSDLSEVLSA